MSKKDITGVYIDGKKVKDICSSPWGIGIYQMDFGGEIESIYGYPPTDINPHDFSPDIECCTPEEIAAWRHACEVYDAK